MSKPSPRKKAEVTKLFMNNRYSCGECGQIEGSLSVITKHLYVCVKGGYNEMLSSGAKSRAKYAKTGKHRRTRWLKRKLHLDFLDDLGPVPEDTGSFFNVKEPWHPLFWDKKELLPEEFPLELRVFFMKQMSSYLNNTPPVVNKSLVFADVGDKSFKNKVMHKFHEDKLKQNHKKAGSYFTKRLTDASGEITVGIAHNYASRKDRDCEDCKQLGVCNGGSYRSNFRLADDHVEAVNKNLWRIAIAGIQTEPEMATCPE